MGRYTTTVSFKDDTLVSAERAAEAFNRVAEALLGAGMEQVDDLDYAGQAGLFVDGTPGTGETQVVIGSTTGRIPAGFKVFKHPTLDLYLKVNFNINNYSGSRAFADISYNIGTSIDSGELDDPSDEITYVTGGNTNSTVSAATTDYVSLVVDVTDNACLILSGSNVRVYGNPVSNSYVTNADGKTSNLALYIQSYENSIIAIYHPIFEDSNPILIRDDYLSPYPSARLMSKGSSNWKVRIPGSLCGLADVPSIISDAGTRVGRARIVIDEKVVDINIALINTSLVDDGDVVTLDIGEGEQTYRVCHSFGPANCSARGVPVKNLLSFAFPWSAE